MKPFLLELAESLFAACNGKPENATVVFPNRRAALYFRKYLGAQLTKPAFSPKLLTIEEFIGSFTALRVPAKLELVHLLSKAYHQVSARSEEGQFSYYPEPFDRFYFWGEMLLRDFDEADRYMVKTELLFRDLSHQKELDSTYDYLSDEQRDFLKSFWKSFDEKDSLNQKRFLSMWKRLPEVYEAYRKALLENGLAYDGLLHRQVAETIAGKSAEAEQYTKGGRLLWFAGFNALTLSEETIISHFVDAYGASVVWDVDDYYFNNETQEAAKFFREYRQHKVLSKTFPPEVPANLKTVKNIELYGAPHPVGQARLVSQMLQERLLRGFIPEETLIVLPDEKLLMPVLHGISGTLDKLNVTMGFPMGSTPLYNMVELLIELQISCKDEHFNHRPVVTLLGHPYLVAANAAEAQAKRRLIISENRVYVPEGLLRSGVSLHRIIFTPVVGGQDLQQQIISYLKAVITETGRLPNLSDFDREYCYHFVLLLNRLETVMRPGEETEAPGPADEKSEESNTRSRRKERLKSFLRLFRQLINGEKVPFRGEPLRGLQVMGVLETRNLDFKNVFILSLNEGSLPSGSGKGSYIPFNIRKAYGLPTPEQQDAISAYLFYRMFQRAENVFLFYNTESDALGQGEMSRYLQQLLFESGINIRKKVLHNELSPFAQQSFSVDKDEKVFTELARFCSGSGEKKYLSPSALNEYIECRLRFYFRYIARVKEANEVEEDLDARILGNFLHRVMELFYEDVRARKGSSRIDKHDLERTDQKINDLLDYVFAEHYHLDQLKKVVYEGQRLVVREIVKRFVDRIISFDHAWAPFDIAAIERRDLFYPVTLSAHGSPVVVISGSIDRADRKGNAVRVVDYKTGKDSTNFDGVASLFDRQFKERNKAAFQTLFYSLLYIKNETDMADVKVVPGLMNRLNLFQDNFTFGLHYRGKVLEDATPLLPEFEDNLEKLLTEIYDPAVPFDQTTDTRKCDWCSYNEICFRQR